jgi:phage FluMu protein Com
MDSANHITFSCPSCAKMLSVESRHAGKKARCPQCRTVFAIPPMKDSQASTVASTAQPPETAQPPADASSPSASTTIPVPDETAQRPKATEQKETPHGRFDAFVHHGLKSLQHFARRAIRRVLAFLILIPGPAKSALHHVGADLEHLSTRVRQRIHSKSASHDDSAHTSPDAAQEAVIIADTPGAEAAHSVPKGRQEPVLIAGIIAIGAILLCVTVGLIVFALTPDSPEPQTAPVPAPETPEQKQKGEIKALITRYLDSQKKGEYGQPYFKDMRNAKRFDALTNWDILDCFVTKDSAIASVRIDSSAPDGKPATKNWIFLLEKNKDGEWKIFDIVLEP